MRDKVVLFYPPYDGPPLGPPLSLLALASPLLDAGFQVSIVDAAIDPDFYETLASEGPNALCLGISLLTGPAIRSAAHVSRFVRKVRPELPIIFGGWHPSLLPIQTLEAGFVDVVVRGQGELTFLELVRNLAEGKRDAEILGTSSSADGNITHNPSRPVENINKLPLPAFHLGDFDAYEKVSGARKVGYASSLGCPYACNYCTDQVFYKRRFNAYRTGRVVGEVTELVSRYRLREVAFLDSNFLVDTRRALEIARGFVRSGVKFRWTFQASTDLLCRMSDDDVRLLGEAGVSHMGFGTESASQEVLALMNKKHQRIDEMFETARKAELAGIRVTFNLILGYPGETETDRAQTFAVMSEISRQYSNVKFSPNIFTPYPGIPIWPQLREMGVREPRSLQEWASVSLGSNHLPWLQGEDLRRLKRMLEYFLLNNQIRRSAPGYSWAKNGLRKVLEKPLRWRLRGSHYSFPWELWVARAAERLVTRRSLLTGQALSHEMQEIC
jgi:anaerobic magnesium-protoporphyrin IX monomethyl ester cyclase